MSDLITFSDSTKKIIGAVYAIRGAVNFRVPKNAFNPHFKSKFADLPACIDHLRAAMNTESCIDFFGQGKDGSALRIVHVPSGEWVEISLAVVGNNDPQKAGSAITYGRRYGLCAVFGLVADDDDDGNSADSNPEKAAKAKPKAKATQAHDDEGSMAGSNSGPAAGQASCSCGSTSFWANMDKPEGSRSYRCKDCKVYINETSNGKPNARFGAIFATGAR